MVLKNLPPEVREAQEQKLEGLKKQQEIHTRLAAERKIFLRDRKIKFFGEFSSLDILLDDCLLSLTCVAYNLVATSTEIIFHCLERRKIERRIRRLEKLQRTSSAQAQGAEIAKQLSRLKEDLQYVMVCGTFEF